jgi:hypothetical protein
MESAFGQDDPSLSEVRLIGIDVPESNSFVTIRLSLNQPPLTLKRKTTAANATSIELQCLDLIEANLSLRTGEDNVALEFTNNGGSSLRVRIIGRFSEIAIECRFLRLNHVKAYTADHSQKNL